MPRDELLVVAELTTPDNLDGFPTLHVDYNTWIELGLLASYKIL